MIKSIMMKNSNDGVQHFNQNSNGEKLEEQLDLLEEKRQEVKRTKGRLSTTSIGEFDQGPSRWAIWYWDKPERPHKIVRTICHYNQQQIGFLLAPRLPRKWTSTLLEHGAFAEIFCLNVLRNCMNEHRKIMNKIVFFQITCFVSQGMA